MNEHPTPWMMLQSEEGGPISVFDYNGVPVFSANESVPVVRIVRAVNAMAGDEEDDSKKMADAERTMWDGMQRVLDKRAAYYAAKAQGGE